MFREESSTKPAKSQIQMSMNDKREQYRAELRRIHNKAQQKLRRRDLINTNILNSFQEVQDILQQLIRQDRIQELKHRISTLNKDLKEFEGEIFPHGLKLVDLLAKLVWINHQHTFNKQDDKEQWEDEKEQRQIKKIQEQGSPLLVKRLVESLTQEIVMLLANQHLSYGDFALERLRAITNCLWPLFESSETNDIRVLLVVFSHILIDKESYLQVLKEKGLTAKLCAILNEDDQSVHKIHPQILDLLVKYIRTETRIEQAKQVHDITAQMLNNEDRNYFLSFALSMIDTNNPELCQKGLELTRELTQLNNNLCEFISKQTIQQLVNLTRSTNLDICRTALEVVDNIIYFTKASYSECVLDCGILDILEQLIDREEKSSDNYQYARLIKITHIVCNLMTCPLAKRRKLVKTHPIMDRIYRCVYPGSRLLVLGKVFEYFFFASDMNTVAPIIDALLQSISQLDLRDQSRPEHQVYKDIILLLMREAMTYWKEYDHIVQLIQRYNLYWIVQESM